MKVGMWLGWCVLSLPSLAPAQTAAPPVLSVELSNTITQPGNLRLIRPLVLYISDWSGDTPRARAWTNTGAVTANITRQASTPGHWNAQVQYTVVEAPGTPPASGTLVLHLAIHGTTALGSFDGRFRDLQIHGDARAGLTWDFVDPNDDRGMLLWLPERTRPVRAALVWGGDKHSALREDLQAFAAANNLAVIGLEGFTPDIANRDGRIIEADLGALAVSSGHAELATIPVLFTGHSNGGQVAYEYNAWKPERVIAFTVSKGGVYLTWQPSERARFNPAVICGGEKDLAYRIDSIHRLFDANRPDGALWAVEFEEGEAHTFNRSLPLFLLHFQHALDERLPAGATTLLPVDKQRAWLADNATWKDGITRIFPAAGFKGDTSHLSWLLDADVAYAYRGTASYANPYG